MDTPRSVSPPLSPAAPELDDHRLQPHSLPRSNTVSSVVSPISQNGESVISADRRLRPDTTLLFSGQRPHSKDNEHAVTCDDDVDEKHEGGYFRDGLGRRGSVAHSHRSNANPTRQYSGRRYSRTSIRSSYTSRSPSPPNSVDAFASPGQRQRKERSGTVTSHAPSDLGLALHHTHSRRQTFTEVENEVHSSDEASLAAEEDVCFPPPEENRVRGGIDFEEMEDFVLEQRELQARQAMERKMSACNSVKGGKFGPDSGCVFKEPAGDDIVPDTETCPANEKVRLGRETPAPPLANRYSFFSSEMDTTVHAPEIGDLLMEGETFYSLFRGGQSIWWLDCMNPTPEELSMLMKAFSIHPLTAEDIRVQETREKVELFRSYYFVCFRSFVQQKDSKDYMKPINVYVIVFREGVLSFHFTPAPHSANVRRRIRQLRDYVALSSDWICYALIDNIVDSFAPVITEIESDTDAIEDAVFIARSDDYSTILKRISECRKKTMGSMRLLGGKADVIKGFAKRCNEQYQVTPRGEIGLYLGDIQGIYCSLTTSDNFYINAEQIIS